MINTYKEYSEMPQTLTVEQMRTIHEEMLSEIKSVHDPEAVEFYDELLEQAVDYCCYRANWFRWDRAEKMDKDPSRTSSHNSVIVKLNTLARFLKQLGQSAEWRDTLGYEEDNSYNRKRIGDFACYLVFVESLNAR